MWNLKYQEIKHSGSVNQNKTIYTHFTIIAKAFSDTQYPSHIKSIDYFN